MAFVDGETIRGWGVFKGDPWHFDSIHETQAEAQARAAELGEGYKVEFGMNRAGTNDFVYGDISNTSSVNYRPLTLGGAPIALRGRQLVMPFVEPEDEQVKSSGRAYFIEEDRFTPSQFRRLSKSRKVEAMAQWFLANYEDPVHRTSYNGREGGYLWNHGGPYDADIVLQEEFSDLADFDLIQKAVAEVTSDGIFEWAPVESDDDDDYDDSDRPDDDGIYSIDEPLPDISDFDVDEDDAEGEDETTFPELPPGQTYLADDDGAILVDNDGNPLVTDLEAQESRPDPAALRADIERNLSILDEAVEDLQNLVRRTHNNPPVFLDDLPPLEEIVPAIATVQQIVRAELNAPAPDVPLVEEQVSTLRRLAGLIGKTATVIAGVLSTGIAGNVATDALKGDYTIPLTLYKALVYSAQSIQAWVSYMVS